MICTQIGPAGAFFSQRLDLQLGTAVQVELRSGGLDTPLVRMTAEVVRIVPTGSGWPAGFAVRWNHAQCELGQEALLNVLHGVFRMSTFDTHHIQIHGRVASLDMQVLLGDAVPARERRHSVLTEARVSSGISGGHAPVDVMPRPASGGIRPLSAGHEAPPVRTVPASGTWSTAPLSGRSSSGVAIAVAARPISAAHTAPSGDGGGQHPPPLPTRPDRPATPPPLPVNSIAGLGFVVPSDQRPPAAPNAPPAPQPAPAPFYPAAQRTPSALIALPPAPRGGTTPGFAGARPPSRPGGQPGWRPPSIGMTPITDPFGFDLNTLSGGARSLSVSPDHGSHEPLAPPAETAAPSRPFGVGRGPSAVLPASESIGGDRPLGTTSGRDRPVSQMVAAERPLSQPAHAGRVASGVHMPGPAAGARPRPISEIIAGQGPLTPLPQARPRPLSQPELGMSNERTATDHAIPEPEKVVDPRVLQLVDLPMTWLRRHQLVAGTLTGLSTTRAAVVSSGAGPDPQEPVVLHVPIPVAGLWQTVTLHGRLQPGPSSDPEQLRFVVAIERAEEGKNPGALQQFLLARAV